MRATVALALLVGSSGAALAEVAVDRLGNGKLRAVFQPGPAGPWDRISGRAPADVLNELGDVKGDGWPWVQRNPATGRVDAAWTSGGAAGDVYFAVHDGTRWLPYRNLSADAALDALPTAATDVPGNRFVAWVRSAGDTHLVVVTGVAADDSCQAVPVVVSSSQSHPRRPSIAFDVDGVGYLAYEEHRGTGASAGSHVVVDRLAAWRSSTGILWCGGEDTIDVARVMDVRTHQAPPKAPCDVRIHAEQGHVWLTWIDAAGVVGFAELDGAAFMPPGYVSYTAPGGDEAVRAVIRADILR